jgi:Pectate lyase superfamily protein
MKFLTISTILLLKTSIMTAQTSLLSAILPAERQIDWSQAGVPANKLLSFKPVVNITDFGGKPDGITPADEAFQKALHHLGGNEGTIFFPKGNYLFHKSIVMRNRLIIKGEGADKTLLKFDLHGQNDLIRATGVLQSDKIPLNADAAKDTHFIQIARNMGFKKGDWIKLTQKDDSLVTSDWAKGTVGQIFQIQEVTENPSIYIGVKLKLNHPLRKSYVLADLATVQKIQPVEQIGVEALKIKRLDATEGQTSNIYFDHVVQSWVWGVESEKCNYAHITLNASAQVTISGCYFLEAFGYGSGGKGYGVMTQVTSSDCLVEDNIFKTLRHAMILQAGANGNVYAYNYSMDPYRDNFIVSNSVGDFALHGNWTYANLFEGNVGQNIMVDNSHGKNGACNTFFKNKVETWGILVYPGSGDALNFVGNEVTNQGLFYGRYMLGGLDHFEFKNKIRGKIQEISDGKSLPDSFFKKPMPSTEVATRRLSKTTSAPVGILPAQDRYEQGNFCKKR